MKKRSLLGIFISLIIAGGLLATMTYMMVSTVLTKETTDNERNLASRAGLLAAMQTINADLLASTSATLTLEEWCKTHNLAGEPKITATPAPNAQKEITPAQRENLKISSTEPVKYRQVKLSCGDKVFSEADNWYVPSRLSAEMNQQLEITTTPFGRVVLSLQPSRRTLNATQLWDVLPKNWDILKKEELHNWLKEQDTLSYDANRSIFRHQAIVSRSGDNLPISEVHETYKMALLSYFY